MCILVKCLQNLDDSVSPGFGVTGDCEPSYVGNSK